jgi:hypothetical protein
VNVTGVLNNYKQEKATSKKTSGAIIEENLRRLSDFLIHRCSFKDIQQPAKKTQKDVMQL